MKRLKLLPLLIAVWLTAALAIAQNTTLVGTMTTQDIPFTGYLWLSLSRPGNTLITCGSVQYVTSGQWKVIQVVNGALVGTNVIWGADCLNPAAIPYNVQIKDLNGKTLITDQWLIQGTTFDVGRAISTQYAIPTKVMTPIIYGGTGANTSMGALLNLGAVGYSTGTGPPSATCSPSSNAGFLYTNSALTLYQCNNAIASTWQWNVIAVNAAGVYPPAGVAVSNGGGWSASIDPATIAILTATNPTFINNLTVTGKITAGSIETGLLKATDITATSLSTTGGISVTGDSTLSGQTTFGTTPVMPTAPVTCTAGACAFDGGVATTFTVSLSQAVTSSTFANGQVGIVYTFIWTQNGTGGYACSYPAGTIGASPCYLKANGMTTQTFLWNGVYLKSIGAAIYG